MEDVGGQVFSVVGNAPPAGQAPARRARGKTESRLHFGWRAG